jgi:Mn-dependent DtxR family transcriptional regulator
LTGITKRRTRIDDVFDVIVRYAETYPGSTPTQAEIAHELGISQPRVHFYMKRLEEEGRIEYVGRHTYYVPRSAWEPPPEPEPTAGD